MNLCNRDLQMPRNVKISRKGTYNSLIYQCSVPGYCLKKSSKDPSKDLINPYSAIYTGTSTWTPDKKAKRECHRVTLPLGCMRAIFVRQRNYIMPMPPMPGLGIAGAGFSSFFSAMTHSVVRNIPAIDAAFSKATRVTRAGSITPAAMRFS